MEQFIQGRYPTLEGGLLFWAGVLWWLLCIWLLWRAELPFSFGDKRATLALRLLCWAALLGLPLGLVAFLHPEYAYSTVFPIWQSLTGVLCLAAVAISNFQTLTGRKLADSISQKDDFHGRLDRFSNAFYEKIGKNLAAEDTGHFGVAAAIVAFFPWIGLLADGGFLQVIAMHAIFCLGVLMLMFIAPQQKQSD